MQNKAQNAERKKKHADPEYPSISEQQRARAAAIQIKRLK